MCLVSFSTKSTSLDVDRDDGGINPGWVNPGRSTPREDRVALISAPMFCLVMFQGVSRHFVSAASGSYPPMGQIEV